MSNNSSPPIHMIDHCFTSTGSHSLSTAIAFWQATSTGEFWANRAAPYEHARLCKLFRWSRWSAIGWAKGRGRHPLFFKMWFLVAVLKCNLFFYLDVRKKMPRVTTQEIWFNINSSQFSIYALLLCAFLRQKELRILAFFQSDPAQTLRPVGYLVRILRMTNLQIATETEEMARKFEGLLHLPCAHFRCPMPLRDLHMRTFSHVKPINFAIFGNPRIEKGIDILVAAIPLVADLITAGRLKFIIQFPSNQISTSELESVATELHTHASAYSGIEIIKNALTENEYSEFLSRADVAILPYRSSAYAIRSSMVIDEAICAGLPVIVTRQTLLSKTLKEHGVGEFFDDGDPISLASAIRKIVESPQSVYGKAYDRALLYRKTFSPDSIISAIRDRFS